MKPSIEIPQFITDYWSQLSIFITVIAFISVRISKKFIKKFFRSQRTILQQIDSRLPLNEAERVFFQKREKQDAANIIDGLINEEVKLLKFKSFVSELPDVSNEIVLFKRRNRTILIVWAVYFTLYWIFYHYNISEFVIPLSSVDKYIPGEFSADNIKVNSDKYIGLMNMFFLLLSSSVVSAATKAKRDNIFIATYRVFVWFLVSSIITIWGLNNEPPNADPSSLTEFLTSIYTISFFPYMFFLVALVWINIRCMMWLFYKLPLLNIYFWYYYKGRKIPSVIANRFTTTFSKEIRSVEKKLDISLFSGL